MCWVLQPAHLPGQRVPLSCLLLSPPSLVVSVPIGSPPTLLPLLGPQHPLEHGLGLTMGRRGWMEQGGCAGGGGRQSLVVPSSPGHGAHSNAALASGTGEMAWAAGELSWSLPSVTHTHHTPGRGQGQC